MKTDAYKFFIGQNNETKRREIKKASKFFIGQNNETKRREIKKASKITAKYLKGFSVLKDVIGYWNGEQERSFIIEALNTEDSPINDIIAFKLKEELKKELKQFEILVQKQEVFLS